MNAVARPGPTRSVGWIRSGDAAFVLLLLLTTRALLTVIGVISRLLLQPLRIEPYPWSYSKSLWLSIWDVWDSGWYLDVAKFGNSSALRQDSEILHQANSAFFPLPLLVAMVSKNPSLDDGLTATHALLQGALVVFWVNGFKLVV